MTGALAAWLLYPGLVFSIVLGASLAVVRQMAGGWHAPGPRERSGKVSPSSLAAIGALAGACALAPLPRSPLLQMDTSVFGWLQLTAAGAWLVFAGGRSPSQTGHGQARLLIWAQACTAAAILALVVAGGASSAAPAVLHMQPPPQTGVRAVVSAILLLAAPATLAALRGGEDLGSTLAATLTVVPPALLVAGLFTSGGAGWLDLIRGVALALGAALVVVFVEGNLRSVSAARLARVYSTGLFPLACLLVGASLVAATQS